MHLIHLNNIVHLTFAAMSDLVSTESRWKEMTSALSLFQWTRIQRFPFWIRNLTVFWSKVISNFKTGPEASLSHNKAPAHTQRAMSKEFQINIHFLILEEFTTLLQKVTGLNIWTMLGWRQKLQNSLFLLAKHHHSLMLALTAIVTIPLCESTFNYNVESHILGQPGWTHLPHST